MYFTRRAPPPAFLVVSEARLDKLNRGTLKLNRGTLKHNCGTLKLNRGIRRLNLGGTLHYILGVKHEYFAIAHPAGAGDFDDRPHRFVLRARGIDPKRDLHLG